MRQPDIDRGRKCKCGASFGLRVPQYMFASHQPCVGGESLGSHAGTLWRAWDVHCCMRRHVVAKTTWACCMGDVQEFDVELRAHRGILSFWYPDCGLGSFGFPDGILSYVRLRAYRICALGELRRCGLWYVPYCDGGAGALSGDLR